MCVCVRQLPPDFFIYISIIKTVLCLHVSAQSTCTQVLYVCVYLYKHLLCMCVFQV